MKRVEVELPDEPYYQYQQMAGEAQQDTDDFIRGKLLDEVEYDDKQGGSQRDLRELILDWDWPENQPKEGSVKLENVNGVIKRMVDGMEFSKAAKRRAEKAKKEDSSRQGEYAGAVRSDCTRSHRGVAHGVDEFEKEVEKMLKSNNVYPQEFPSQDSSHQYKYDIE